MRVRVLCTNMKYGCTEYPFGAEFFMRDTDALHLLINGAIEPAGRPAIQRASELKLQAEHAESARLAEIHRDRMAVNAANLLRASQNGTF